MTVEQLTTLHLHCFKAAIQCKYIHKVYTELQHDIPTLCQHRFKSLLFRLTKAGCNCPLAQELKADLLNIGG